MGLFVIQNRWEITADVSVTAGQRESVEGNGIAEQMAL
jgi:hypothetical protein